MNNTPWVNSMVEHYPDYMSYRVECIIWGEIPIDFKNFITLNTKKKQENWNNISDDLTALN